MSPEGFWIGEQVTDRVILMDINGKVLKAFQTECHNCSGLAVGGGYLWLSANGAAQFDRPIKIENNSSGDSAVPTWTAPWSSATASRSAAAA